MNATPPEANSEYSRGPGRSERVVVTRSGAAVVPGAARAQDALASGTLRAVLFAGGVLGALLLLGAEFTTLFQLHVAATKAPVRSVSTGSHHSYAMALIAVVAAGLAVAVWRAASRPALLALGVLGVTALLIALLADLPDASATGLVLTSGHYVNASSTPSAGFYMETLGAIILLITSVSGFLLIGAPANRRA
jgi:hypothetical protein